MWVTSMFNRKVYSKLLEWKRESNGKSAVLIEGAQRVGKTTLIRGETVDDQLQP